MAPNAKSFTMFSLLVIVICLLYTGVRVIEEPYFADNIHVSQGAKYLHLTSMRHLPSMRYLTNLRQPSSTSSPLASTLDNIHVSQGAKYLHLTSMRHLPSMRYLTNLRQPSSTSSPSASTLGRLTNAKKVTSSSKNATTPTEIVYCKNIVGTYYARTLGEHYEEKAIRRHPNLPFFLTNGSRLSKSMPDIPSIRWSGSVYQESWRETPKCFLYSAHFDARPKDGLVIRLNVFYEGDVPLPQKPKYYCQIWHNQTEAPSVIPVYDAYISNKRSHSKYYKTPYVLSCKVPSQLETFGMQPIVVSLVKVPCETPTNVLQIAGTPVRKMRNTNSGYNTDIAVCSRSIYYYNIDFSNRLVEWIEFMRSLGVSKIYLYEMACHENVSKVLDYYEKEGFLQIFSYHCLPPMISEGTFFRVWSMINYKAHWSSEYIYHSDCILRNHDKHDYLGVWDFDEVPALRMQTTLKDFIIAIRKMYPQEAPRRAIFLQWKFFYQEFLPGPSAANISNKFFMLTHNRRVNLRRNIIDEENGKSIHDTKYAFSVNSHVPLLFVDAGDTYNLKISRSYAYMAHFQITHLFNNMYPPSEIEEDNILHKYKNAVMDRATAVFQKLKL